jgi:UDP-N-acetylmuramate dehydrogenase
MQIQENVALGPLTTLRVGGRARFFVRATTVEDVQAALAFARARKHGVFVLGGGSNVVVSDRGWPGLVLQVATSGIGEEHKQDKVHLTVGAGEDWDGFVRHSVERNFAGVECLSGIPGSVGGTPVQNVGAYGQEVSETIVSLLAFDRVDSCVRELQASACAFGYRTSTFNTTQRERYIILRVSYALTPGGAPRLRYRDLEEHFSGRDRPPTLSAVRQAVLEIRASKGMLITLDDPENRSAGSFFKNPVLTAAEYEALVRRAQERSLQLPSYPALSERKKIPAAWLVENSGFSKGDTRGRVGISSKHALALINRGGASAEEVIALKEEIEKQVEATWGIKLEPEPVLVGF